MFQTTINKLNKIFDWAESEIAKFKSNHEEQDFYDGVRRLKQALDGSDRFGAFGNTHRKYAVMILNPEDNSFRWVTEMNGCNRTFKYEYGKPAYFFEDSWWCEDFVSGCICNGYSAFIVTVPDIFKYEDFVNPEKPTK